MRTTFGRYFDVVVVVWALALGISWSVYSLGHAPIGGDQWAAPHAAQAWSVYEQVPAGPYLLPSNAPAP